MIPITKQEKPLRKRSTFSIVFSQRAAGGGIAVWTDLLNGLSRAALKPEPEQDFQMDISVRKELRGGTVGADGDHNRYLVAYMFVYGVSGQRPI